MIDFYRLQQVLDQRIPPSTQRVMEKALAGMAPHIDPDMIGYVVTTCKTIVIEALKDYHRQMTEDDD